MLLPCLPLLSCTQAPLKQTVQVVVDFGAVCVLPCRSGGVPGHHMLGRYALSLAAVIKAQASSSVLGVLDVLSVLSVLHVHCRAPALAGGSCPGAGKLVLWSLNKVVLAPRVERG